MHGGGLVLGSAAMADGHCGETARETGVTIVSVDHRFAPRHPFPAAIDDCYTAWQLLDGARAWLGAHLER
jgi:acetyl esterase/lipase